MRAGVPHKPRVNRIHVYTCMYSLFLPRQQVFVGEQQLYSKGELQRHVDKGEPSQGFLGHPVRALHFTISSQPWVASSAAIYLTPPNKPTGLPLLQGEARVRHG